MAIERQSGRGPIPALVFGENTGARRRIGQALSRGGFAIRQAGRLAEALEALERETLSLVFAIADPDDPHPVEEIKKRAPHSEVILVADHPCIDPALDALCRVEDEEGEPAERPVKASPGETEIDALRRENARLERINRILLEDSLLDPQTGLNNERFLMQMVECEIVRSQRRNRSFSLLFTNIDMVSAPRSDSYSEYNLRLIQVLAGQLRSRLRRSDLLTCYQEGIFGILLPETDREGAYQVAEALCNLLETTWMLSFADRTSMTMGIAVYPEDGEEASQLFGRALRQISH